MRVTLPPLNIPEENPFQHDLFGREDFANRLSNLIERLDEGLVMSINASWGEGKTTFVKMWASHLRHKKVKCIYLDAFAQDYIDDAFMMISSEISSSIEAEFEEGKDPTKRLEDFKKKASRVGLTLLSLGTNIALKVATSDLIGSEDLKRLKDSSLQSEPALISAAFENRLSNHRDDVEAIESFVTELESLAGEIKNETTFPLIFIIDELDRCKPTFALDVIEKIKHFFSTKNIVFVLVMNTEQLQSSVRRLYGEAINASAYLQKFINLECQLPKNEDRTASDHNKYCDHLYKAHDLKITDDEDTLQYSMQILSEALDLSLRDLEKCYSALTLYYASVTENAYSNSLVTAFLVILKINFPSIYNQLKKNELGYEGLIAKQELIPNTQIGKRRTHYKVPTAVVKILLAY
jgi:hypothetical protein